MAPIASIALNVMRAWGLLMAVRISIRIVKGCGFSDQAEVSARLRRHRWWRVLRRVVQATTALAALSAVAWALIVWVPGW